MTRLTRIKFRNSANIMLFEQINKPIRFVSPKYSRFKWQLVPYAYVWFDLLSSKSSWSCTFWKRDEIGKWSTVLLFVRIRLDRSQSIKKDVISFGEFLMQPQPLIILKLYPLTLDAFIRVGLIYLFAVGFRYINVIVGIIVNLGNWEYGIQSQNFTRLHLTYKQ